MDCVKVLQGLVEEHVSSSLLRIIFNVLEYLQGRNFRETSFLWLAGQKTANVAKFISRLKYLS